jgi:hypothetical protein
MTTRVRIVPRFGAVIPPRTDTLRSAANTVIASAANQSPAK